MYTKYKDIRTCYTDIDSTLIAYSNDPQFDPNNTLILGDGDHRVFVSPILPNITLLKDLKAIGFNIVAWSQGGSDHASRVIDLLELENLIDVILPKPEFYVDDLPFEQQYIKRVFKN